eukprot:TRINITY_DN5269_c0_g1_i1.p1 TRINITY_DN5269_c0_g1~~TRINITY_DN5269_c0_g1_i1.p1  ORF type:complete len:204 (-),score=41.82 TRINITY_DN5269_c0_g1_i1:48-659(-)
MATKLVAIIMVILFGCNAIQFDLPQSNKKCLSDDYNSGDIIYGSYQLDDFSDIEFTFTIISPTGEELERSTIEGENFAIEAANDGEYSFCFENKRVSRGSSAKKRVTFVLKEESSRTNWDEIAKKENLKPVQVTLRKLEKKSSTLKSQFKAMRRREAKHRDLSESMNERVPYLSVFTIVVLVILGGWQMFYLRSFFKSNDIID